MLGDERVLTKTYRLESSIGVGMLPELSGFQTKNGEIRLTIWEGIRMQNLKESLCQFKELRIYTIRKNCRILFEMCQNQFCFQGG